MLSLAAAASKRFKTALLEGFSVNLILNANGTLFCYTIADMIKKKFTSGQNPCIIKSYKCKIKGDHFAQS